MNGFRLVVIGCVAALTACGGGGTPRSLGDSASPTPSASASATAAPLPNGYIALTDHTGLVSIGVPHAWFHARLDGSDPMLTRLENGKGRVGTRWRSFAKSQNDGGVFAAADPLSADAVLLIEREVGVEITDLDRLDRELRPELAKAGTIRSSEHIKLDGKPGLRYHIDYTQDAGAVVHEVIDFFDVGGTIVDFTYTGAPGVIAAVAATVHFHSG
ncbi:MAG: hypothetical protein QOC82_1352 [Frankiaceae bacterium]|jgi:hypothetical protein|nr:hypothetical protein [Frankiaceae bacterium]